MAQIVLGLGTSHSPMLSLGPEDWPRMAERDAERPVHLDIEGRPTSFAALLEIADPAIRRELTPERMAARQGETQAAIARLGDTLAAARLDALIVIGDDQDELFHAAHMPSVLVYRGESIRNRAPARRPGPAWFARSAAGYYETDGARDYPVDAALAEHLTCALIEQEFDVAASDALPPEQGEGHAFGFVHRRIMTKAVVPIVPVFLNTYYPPNQPTPRRCYRLGQAIRAAVESYPGAGRIGVIASGGLSHFTVDETLDRAVLRAVAERDAAALMALPTAKLQSGSSEIRSWICAAGALEHLTVTWTCYVPGQRSPAGTGTGLAFATWS